MRKTFYIITFGCQMNVRESQWLEAILLSRGLDKAGLNQADVVILNTCSVREKPDSKIKSVLARLKHERRAAPNYIVAVLGCAAQRAGSEIFSWDSAVRLVAGADGLPETPDALEEILQNDNLKLELRDFAKTYKEKSPDRLPLTTRSSQVSIMQGCDNFCSYCIVPYTRGRQRSRQPEAIIAECERRLCEGNVELTLLGQNVNAWGRDLGTGENFSALLSTIAQLPGLARLGFVAPYPSDMDDASIEAIRSCPNILPHLHLPLQSGSDSILKAMRRRYNCRQYLDLMAKLKKARADMVFSTDIIVGFPGETDGDFNSTLQMMQECGFVSSYSFKYSDRPGTRASLMPDKIRPEVMTERLMVLQQLQERLTSSWLVSRVGKNTEVLLEKQSVRDDGENNSWQGKDRYGATVHVSFTDRQNHAGELIEARITASKKHCLLGYL